MVSTGSTNVAGTLGEFVTGVSTGSTTGMGNFRRASRGVSTGSTTGMGNLREAGRWGLDGLDRRCGGTLGGFITWVSTSSTTGMGEPWEVGAPGLDELDRRVGRWGSGRGSRPQPDANPTGVGPRVPLNPPGQSRTESHPGTSTIVQHVWVETYPLDGYAGSAPPVIGPAELFPAAHTSWTVTIPGGACGWSRCSEYRRT